MSIVDKNRDFIHTAHRTNIDLLILNLVSSIVQSYQGDSSSSTEIIYLGRLPIISGPWLQFSLEIGSGFNCGAAPLVCYTIIVFIDRAHFNWAPLGLFRVALQGLLTSDDGQYSHFLHIQCWTPLKNQLPSERRHPRHVADIFPNDENARLASRLIGGALHIMTEEADRYLW